MKGNVFVTVIIKQVIFQMVFTWDKRREHDLALSFKGEF